MNVDHEVNLLVEEIHRLGSKNADGKLSVKFGVLFRDDKCANLFEALVGTLKAAKRRKSLHTQESYFCKVFMMMLHYIAARLMWFA
uniref:Costars family protein ABRACL n=1 Tax=Sus scrofa TaxID=9823 RepID=A0A8D1TNK7_PIG